ncbi:chemotaxis protein CheY [Acrasis kona]|uniref:Chemotaxis protein CheY n=1 Tax=Acrasis kona TaxID=1008807 RepID=A0AAW2YZK7_9EUKA
MNTTLRTLAILQNLMILQNWPAWCANAHFIDSENKNVLFKSRKGFELESAKVENPEENFCVQCVLSNNDYFEVPDSSKHPTLKNSPAAQGGVKFYSSIPLVLDGERLGSLCVIDHTPKSGLTEYQREIMRKLAAQLESQLASRKYLLEVMKKEQELELHQKELNNLIGTISHDIRQPLGSIMMATELVLKSKLNPTQQLHLYNIMDNAKFLEEYFEQALRFVRIEASPISDQNMLLQQQSTWSREYELRNVAEQPESPPRHKRFLIADDNDTMIKLMTTLLSRRGHHVTSVSDGCELLDVIRQKGLTCFDVILADEEMPKMKGSDAIKQIRDMESLSNIPVKIISTSGHADQSFVDFIKKCGASMLLNKPFRTNQFIDACEN